MRNIIQVAVLLVGLMALTACGDSGGGGGSSSPNGTSIVGPEPKDPIYGTWTSVYPNSTTEKIRGYGTAIKEDGSFVLMSMLIQPNDGNMVMIFRKSIGTFTRNGDLMTINYSYATCGSPTTEDMNVKIDPNNINRLFVATPDGSLFFTMSRSLNPSSDFSITAIEDKNCDLM